MTVSDSLEVNWIEICLKLIGSNCAMYRRVASRYYFPILQWFLKTILIKILIKIIIILPKLVCKEESAPQHSHLNCYYVRAGRTIFTFNAPKPWSQPRVVSRQWIRGLHNDP